MVNGRARRELECSVYVEMEHPSLPSSIDARELLLPSHEQTNVDSRHHVTGIGQTTGRTDGRSVGFLEFCQIVEVNALTNRKWITLTNDIRTKRNEKTKNRICATNTIKLIGHRKHFRPSQFVIINFFQFQLFVVVIVVYRLKICNLRTLFTDAAAAATLHHPTSIKWHVAFSFGHIENEIAILWLCRFRNFIIERTEHTLTMSLFVA